MTEPWGELLDELNRPPIWDGHVPISVGVGRVTFWWQAWTSLRVDVGFTTTKALSSDESMDVAIVRKLVFSLAQEVVVPLLEEVESGWTVECRPTTVVSENAGRGRERTRVAGKLTVRVAGRGSELDPLLNGLRRFAVDLGWDERRFGR